MDTAMTKLSERRKTYAQHVIQAIKTAFPDFSMRILLVTKRFTTQAEGFEILVPENEQNSVQGFLKKGEYTFTYQGNGNFLIVYPEKYSIENETPKTLIKMFDAEKKVIFRILKQKGFFQKTGRGSAKDKGVFGINRTKNMAETRTISLSVTNRKMDTLNPVLKIIRDYYDNHVKKSFIEIKSENDNFNIQVNFKFGFFKGENIEDLSKKEEESLTSNASGLGTILQEALVENEVLADQVETIKKQIEENKKVFIGLTVDVFIGALQEILQNKNLRVFEDQGKDGLLALVEISPEKIKAEIFTLISEKFN